MANEPMPPAKLLRNAAVLVRRALMQLDTKTAPCPCCRNRRYSNYHEGRASEALTPVPGRLEEHADRLEGPPHTGDPAFVIGSRWFDEHGERGPTLLTEASGLLLDAAAELARHPDADPFVVEQIQSFLKVVR